MSGDIWHVLPIDKILRRVVAVVRRRRWAFGSPSSMSRADGGDSSVAWNWRYVEGVGSIFLGPSAVLVHVVAVCALIPIGSSKITNYDD